MACAVSDCWVTRTWSVRMPRDAFHASNGEHTAPCMTWCAQTAATRSRSAAITPSIASLWPAIPLVAACITMSMPCTSVCCTGGGANVLSHTVNGPWIEPMASRSTMLSPGFAGVSTNTSCVLPGRTARCTASLSVASTNVTSMPSRGHNIANNWLVTENVDDCATT